PPPAPSEAGSSDYSQAAAYHRLPYHSVEYQRVPYQRVPYQRVPYQRVPYHWLVDQLEPVHSVVTKLLSLKSLFWAVVSPVRSLRTGLSRALRSPVSIWTVRVPPAR